MRTHTLVTNNWEPISVDRYNDPIVSASADVLTSDIALDDMDKNAILPAWVNIKMKWLKELWVKWPIWTTISLFN